MKMIIWVLLSSACLCFSCNVKTFEASSTEGSSADGGNHRSGSLTPVLTADDFQDYYNDYSPSSAIYYWKAKDGQYMCFLTIGGGNTPASFQSFKNLQTNGACPVSIMREIIEKKRRAENLGQVRNYLYETSPSIDELEYLDLKCSFVTHPSRDRSVYSLLGIEESYEAIYGSSQQVYFNHDGLFESEDNPAFRVSPKHFTNLSHVYRWAKESGEIRYGFAPENDNQICGYVSLYLIQSDFNFSLSEMRRIIEAYYSVTDTAEDNLVVDVPVVGGYYQYTKEVVEPFPDNISDDAATYSGLGLEESYRRHFGVK